MEADRPEIKDRFSFMEKETYNSLPLTRWLDKSGKPIEDHFELPTEHRETTILKRQSGMPVETLLQSKMVRETLKAKGYDLDELETGKKTVGQNLTRLLENLANDKHVVSTRINDETESPRMRSIEVPCDKISLEAEDLEKKLVLQALIEIIPEEILKQRYGEKKCRLKRKLKEWMPRFRGVVAK